MNKPIDVKTIRKSLRAKGFIKSEKKRDHEMYFLHINNKKTGFWVKISRGVQEMRTDEIKNNARSVKIKTDHLYKILKCDFNKTETKDIYNASCSR